MSSYLKNTFFPLYSGRLLSKIRIYFYSLFIIFFWFTPFDRYQRLNTLNFDFPLVLWQPVSFFSILKLQPPSLELFYILNHALLIAVIFSAIGFLTRLSTAISFLLALYIFGLNQCFGCTTHGVNPVLLAMGVLCLSRCGDYYSLDQFLSKNRNEVNSRFSADYGWPIRAVQCLVILTYFSAGVSKLRHSGFNFFEYEHLLNKIAYSVYYYGEYNIPYTRILSDWLVRHPLVMQVFAFLTVLIQLLSPIGIFVRSMSVPVLVSLVFVHFGIMIFMQFLGFTTLFMLYIFWIKSDDFSFYKNLFKRCKEWAN